MSAPLPVVPDRFPNGIGTTQSLTNLIEQFLSWLLFSFLQNIVGFENKPIIAKEEGRGKLGMITKIVKLIGSKIDLRLRRFFRCESRENQNNAEHPGANPIPIPGKRRLKMGCTFSAVD